MSHMRDLPAKSDVRSDDSPPSDPPIGAAEAARILGCDTTTVQRWARTGKLPIALKMPGVTGALLFRREDVEALAKEPAA